VEFALDALRLFERRVLGNPVTAALMTPDAWADRTYSLGTVDAANCPNFYDGVIRVVDPEGEEHARFKARDYRRHLAERVVLLQLMNTAEQQTGEPGMVLQGLVRLEDQEAPFYLKLKNRKRKARPGGGQDTCQVLVYLATPRLGQVMGRLVLAEGLLTCEITVEHSPAGRLFNSLLPGLRAKLQDLPWRVNLLPCRVQNPGAIHAAGSREFGFALPREGLDVLV